MMRGAVIRRLAMALLGVVGGGCHSPGGDDLSPPYQAVVVTSFDGHYRQATVTLQTLTDLRHMSGTVGAIVGNAAFDLSAENDDLVQSADPGRLMTRQGTAVSLQYVVRDGVVYPMEFGSLEMLSLYYAFERTALFWQANYEKTVDVPPKLYYNPAIGVGDGSTSLEGMMKMNAAFLPATSDFLFFKTSRAEQFPVKINLAIIAHEYFHSIFHREFAAGDSRIYLGASFSAYEQLCGINEGLADFFAYLVTGNTFEYGQSIPALNDQRNMPVPWTLSTLDNAPCAGSYYCKGSLLASALHEIATQFDYRPVDVGAGVLRALAPFREDWLKLRDGDNFDYDVFLNRLIAPLGAGDRMRYCNVFAKWFDDAQIRKKLTCN